MTEVRPRFLHYGVMAVQTTQQQEKTSDPRDDMTEVRPRFLHYGVMAVQTTQQQEKTSDPREG